MLETRAASFLRPKELELCLEIFGGLAGELGVNGIAIRTAVTAKACRNIVLRNAATGDFLAARRLLIFRRCGRPWLRQRGKMPCQIGEVNRVNHVRRNCHDAALAVSGGVSVEALEEIGFALSGENRRRAAAAQPVLPVAP